MRNVITICTIAVLVLVMSAPSQGAVLHVRAPGGITVFSGGVYPSIQAAIDDAAPGDTIEVHSGTYKEQIVIWKELTLKGVGSTTPVIDGVNGTGAEVTVVDINAPGDVNFINFVVKNAPITNPSDLRFGILTHSSVEGVTYTISNSTVMGTNNPDAEQDYGIYGRNGGKENLVIKNNVVTQTGSNNIVLETHQGSSDISYNTLNAGCYGVDAIFVMTHSGKDVANLQKVSHNTIDMGTGTGTTSATGISIAAVGEYYGVSPARFLAHSIEITNNNLSNLKANRRGIGFWNDASGDGSAGNIISPLVSNNIITGASGSVGASMGMDTLGLVTDANITDNSISGLDYSFKERVWRSNIAAGTQLSRNCFSGDSNGVLTERTTGTLNAVGNFWGDASGPYHPITNPGGLGDKVSDNVSYYPWYPNCSFTTPVHKPVHNVTLGAYYDKLQPAMDAARNSDLITADAGTYVEAVNITRSVTLQGASGAVIKPDNTTPLLDGGVRRVAIYINGVDNVNISGFEIDGTGGDVHIGIYGLNSDNSTISNMVVHDMKNAIDPPVGDVAGLGIMFFGWGQGITGALIQGNTVYNTGRMGIWVGGMNSSTYNFMIASGNIIRNNIVHDTWQGPTNDGGGAIQINGAKDSSFAQNSIYSTGNNWFGIYVSGSSTGNTITDNEVYNNKYGIVAWSNVTFVEYGGNAAAAPSAHCNKIHGNTTLGLRNIDTDPAYKIDAKNNWWGDASGPGGAGGGSGDKVSANVDFFPWLLSSTDCGSTTQVAPDFVVDDNWTGLPNWTTVTVDGVNYYIGLNAFDAIQKAINAAADGNNIRVLPGTYNEAVVINKSLGIRGATSNLSKNGYAVPADYAWDDSVESIINHPNPAVAYNAVVDIEDVNNVTFEGFVVQELHAVGNLDSSLIRVYAHTHEISNIKIRNNIIGASTNITSQDGAQGRMGLYIVNYPYSNKGVVNSEFSGNKIFDCKGNGDNVFIWSSYFAYGAPSAASMRGTVIKDNEIYGSHRSGIESAGGFADLTIQNNKIYGSTGLPSDDPNNLKYGNGILMIRGSSDKTSGPTSAYGPENITIQGNEIYGNQKNGIYTDPIVKGLEIVGNAIRDNGWDAARIDLEGTYWNPTFEPVHGQWSCYNGCSDVKATANNFSKNGGGVEVIGTPTNGFVVEAEYNWWGHRSGPNDANGTVETDGKTCPDVSVIVNADGLGNKVSENVVYCPWLLAPVVVSNSPCPLGDLDGDCDVDFYDLAIMANNWLAGE